MMVHCTSDLKARKPTTGPAIRPRFCSTTAKSIVRVKRIQVSKPDLCERRVNLPNRVHQAPVT